MANILEIQAPQWNEIPAPDNVLEIPSHQPLPQQPAEPSETGQLDVFYVFDAPCGAIDECCMAIHDAVTGWWIRPGGASCPCGETDTCTTFGMSPQEWANYYASTPRALDTIFPAWALAAAGIPGYQLAEWDAWTWACCAFVEVAVDVFQPLAGSCAAPDVPYATGKCPSGYFADPNQPGCCKPLDPPLPAGLRNLAGSKRGHFSVPAELAGDRRRLYSTRFIQEPAREAPPPPLPLLAMQPLPPGNCGCAAPNGEEIDEL